MTEEDSTNSSRPDPDWVRRRRRERIFGDVLPESTSDDRDGSDRSDPEGRGDDWLRAQVPPHHGG